MARRGGLRGRLDRLEGNAHATMGQAQFTLRAIREAATGLLEELEDGVTIEFRRTGSVLDFIQGKTDVLPIAMRIIPKEQGADESPSQ